MHIDDQLIRLDGSIDNIEQGVYSLNGALIGEAVAGVGDDETMMDLDLLGREDQEFLFSSLQDTWRQDTSHVDNQATATQVKTEQTGDQLASSPPVTTIKEEIKEEEPEEH